MVMPAADLAITKSGSVNLELALFNVSQAKTMLQCSHEEGAIKCFAHNKRIHVKHFSWNFLDW
jgi:lipid A disaccharide synthetase